MCMDRYIALFIAMLSSFMVQAQEESNQFVSGRVQNNDSIPLADVAIIMQHTDSTYIDATTTDAQGLFRIKHPGGVYRLQFQHLGYKPYNLMSANNELGTIVLEDTINSLAAVVITAERPLLKMENGKLTYDMSVFAQKRIADSAFDLVKELPAISSNNGENLSLNGAIGGTSIIINGKPSTMSNERLNEYLKALPPERVEKVEIVYNAPPYWHIKGAAINLILKKNDQYTLQGQVQTQWKHQHENSYESSGSIFLSNKKVSLDMLYQYKDGNSPFRSIVNSTHTVDEKAYDIQMENNRNVQNKIHDFYSSMNYKLTDKSSIQLTYNTRITPSTQDFISTSSNLFSNSLSENKGKDNTHNIRLDYYSPFKLRIGAKYVTYNSQSLQNLKYLADYDASNAQIAFSYNRHQRVNQFFTYADMSHQFKRNWTLYYGTSYSLNRNINKQAYINNQNEGSEDYEHTNHTDENIVRIYSSVTKSLLNNKLYLYFFLTGEYYQINDYKKTNLLPNATISYVPAAKHLLQFNYSSNKRYPSYWERQEYTSYNNEYSVYYGNPDLRPYTSHNAQLIYVFNNKYMLHLSYYKIKDFFVSQTYQSDESLLLMQRTTNIDYTTSFNAGLTIPMRVKNILESNLNLTTFNTRYKSSNWFNINYDRNKWTGVFQLDNTIWISHKPTISINASILYRTPYTIQGIWDLESTNRWYLNGGIKCAFAKNKAILSFQCYDLLQSATPLIKVQYENQNQYMNSNYYQRSFTLRFTYKFNDYKEKKRQTTDTSRFGIN